MLYVIAVVIIALDQLVKWQIVTHLAVNQSVVIIPRVLDLFYIQNSGAAFSMLIDQRVLLIIVSLLVMIAIMYVDRHYAKGKLDMKVALGLLFGGAAGNLIDRVHLGYVIDYVYLQFIHFPVFNLADSAIVVSIFYLLIRFFVRKDTQSQNSERRELPHE